MRRKSSNLATLGTCLVVCLWGFSATLSAAELPTKLIALGINLQAGAPFTPAQLFEVDKATGNATPLGESFSAEATRIGPNLVTSPSGEVYNISQSQYFNGPAQPIAQINKILPNGTVVPAGVLDPGMPESRVVHAMNFDPAGNLVAVFFRSKVDPEAQFSLGTIDLQTGQTTELRTLKRSANDMAFDPAGNLFTYYGFSGLSQLNVNTGEYIDIFGDVHVSTGSSSYPPLVFDRDGTLYSVTDRLVTIDKQTGRKTDIGSAVFGAYSIIGLTTVPVPEPSTLGWLAATLLALTAWSARSRAAQRLPG